MLFNVNYQRPDGPFCGQWDLTPEQAWQKAEEIFSSDPRAVRIWDHPCLNGQYTVRVASKDSTFFILSTDRSQKVPMEDQGFMVVH